MLKLSRKEAETILIGGNIILTICSIRGNQVVVGIDAPKEILILRSELEAHDDDAAKAVKCKASGCPILFLALPDEQQDLCTRCAARQGE